MSSKKERRKKRQAAQEQSGSRKRWSSATIFMLVMGLTLVILVVGALVLGDSGTQGEPPWPGAVWSSSHDHWH